jgi:hypothetical protein
LQALRNYEVSDQGRVRRVTAARGTVVGKVLKQGVIKSGYPIVVLRVDDKSYTRKVSRLVARAFIPNPLNLPEVNHIDTNKLNSLASNLEWRTGLGNKQHATRHDCRGDGVYFAEDRQRWCAAYAPKPQVWKYIGSYMTYAEAKAARDAVIHSQQEII